MTDNSYLLQYFIEHSPKDAKPVPVLKTLKEQDNKKEAKKHE
jgi:hypothetical protein